MQSSPHDYRVEMRVTGLADDPFSKTPVVILKGTEKRHTLPVWIGLAEAAAIRSELDRIELSRPSTHDLLCELVREVQDGRTQISIDELRDGNYYASIRIPRGRELICLNARASDAIALSLRLGINLQVARGVIRSAKYIDARSHRRLDSDPADPLES